MFTKPYTVTPVVELPPLRTFVVRRSVVYSDGVRTRMEDVSVQAHTLSFEPDGVLAFVTYIIVDNTLVPQFSAALHGWVDFGLVKPEEPVGA